MVVASFDLDETLADRNFDESLWYAAIPYAVREKEGISKNDALRRCLEAYDSVGKDDVRWYSPHYWMERFGIIDRKEEILEGIRDRVRLYPDVVPALNALEERGVRCIVVSNASFEMIEFKLDAEGISRFFSRVFSASTHYNRVAKDGNLFFDVAEKLGVKTSGIYHVGDNEEFDYLLPTSAGVNAFLLDRSGEKSGGHVVASLGDYVKLIP